MLKLAPRQSSFTPGLRWPEGATGQKPLQWVPETTPRLLRVQVPMQSRFPRSDYGNQLPLPVPRTLSDDHIIPSETEGECTRGTFISEYVLCIRLVVHNSTSFIFPSYISNLYFRCFNSETSYIFNLYFQCFSGERERVCVCVCVYECVCVCVFDR